MEFHHGEDQEQLDEDFPVENIEIVQDEEGGEGDGEGHGG